MPWFEFDLEDGQKPVGFSLKTEDTARFVTFMAECQRYKEQARAAPAVEQVQMPDKARAGIEVLHQAVEALLTTSRYVDEESEATHALADLLSCIAEPPFRLADSSTDGVQNTHGGEQ